MERARRGRGRRARPPGLGIRGRGRQAAPEEAQKEQTAAAMVEAKLASLWFAGQLCMSTILMHVFSVNAAIPLTNGLLASLTPRRECSDNFKLELITFRVEKASYIFIGRGP